MSELLSFPTGVITRLEKHWLEFPPLYFLLGQRDVNTSQWTAGLLEKGGRKHKLPLVCSSKENLGAKATGVEMGKMLLDALRITH